MPGCDATGRYSRRRVAIDSSDRRGDGAVVVQQERDRLFYSQVREIAVGEPPTIADLLHEKFDPERKLVTSFESENCQIYIDQDRRSKLGLTLRDLAQFLESRPYIFAVFTNDEVAREAGMNKAPTSRAQGKDGRRPAR